MIASDFPLLYGGFVALTVITLLAFYLLTGRKAVVLVGGAIWLTVAAFLAKAGFFLVTDTVPPRIGLLLVPMLVGGALVGFGGVGKSLRGKAWLEGLHYFHGIRILVEVVFLHGLYEAGFVAQAMTYEGLNYDLVPGILLPVVGLLVFRLGVLTRGWAVVANLFGIAVLAWTVVTAVLSAPSSYQVFSPEQPTVAIFHFPFVWLPALVAPLMFWAHFIGLKLLMRRKEGA